MPRSKRVIACCQQALRNPFGPKGTLTYACMLLVYAHRWLLSPFLPPCCRFQPSCSRYALAVFAAHGVFKGGWLTLKRLLKCHPWHAGGLDLPPVPAVLSPGEKQEQPASMGSSIPIGITHSVAKPQRWQRQGRDAALITHRTSAAIAPEPFKTKST